MAANSVLPHILAVINVSTVAALATGYMFIRRGDRGSHRKSMLMATGLGVVFLVLYLSYHFGAGLAKFGGTGSIRPIYFSILIVHIITAAVAALIVPVAIVRALSGRFAAHKKLAPFAWRLWMFVAISGLIVYVMTIHIWPYAGEGA